MPKPGGDKIGRRRIDTHLLGFQNLGARFNFDKDDKGNYFLRTTETA
jgi:UDP-N-acetylglucosamine 1-carboxyvinyltransferase